jgi:hypothetical protein
VSQSGNFSLPLGAGTTQTSFTVNRVNAGASTTVPLFVTDGCGEWQTFVGGGSGAF